jgi:hypothetical protein
MTAPIDHCPQFAILAPKGATVPRASGNVIRDKARHACLLGEMQRLRGRVALDEGVVAASMLDHSGRHLMPRDGESWHLLLVGSDGNVAGCARLLVHPRDVTFRRLRLASSPAARCGVWAQHVRDAVESELTRARLNGLTAVEPGGWVVDESLRGTWGAFSIAIGAFAWAQILGAGIAFVTATEKHGSATILRRIGGRSLQARGQTIPRYFDPAWGCNAELLRFDTDSLNPRFEAAMSSARRQLLSAPVFSADPARRERFPSHTIQDVYQPIFAVGRIDRISAGSVLRDPLPLNA